MQLPRGQFQNRTDTDDGGGESCLPTLMTEEENPVCRDLFCSSTKRDQHKNKRQLYIVTQYSSTQEVMKSEMRTTTEQHDSYRDYAHMIAQTEQKIVTKGGVKEPFPVKLFNLLAIVDLYETDLASIISWQPHGRCFRVHDQKKAEELILPRFFKQRLYSSFRRQLNLWGFTRLNQPNFDGGAYYHEMFLRSKPFLCRIIGRSGASITASKKRLTSDLDSEPKFYSMTPLPPSMPSCLSGSRSFTDEEDTNIQNGNSSPGVSAAAVRPSSFLLWDRTFVPVTRRDMTITDDFSRFFLNQEEPTITTIPSRHPASNLDLSNSEVSSHMSNCSSTFDGMEDEPSSITLLRNAFSRQEISSSTDSEESYEDPNTRSVVHEESLEVSEHCHNLEPFPKDASPPMTREEIAFMAWFLPKLG